LKRAGDIPAGSVKREGINIVVTAGYVESQTIELPLFDYSRNKNVVSIDEGWVDDHYEVEVPEASIKETEATVTISEGYIPEQKIFYKDTGSGTASTIDLSKIEVIGGSEGTVEIQLNVSPGQFSSETTITKQFNIMDYAYGESGEYWPGRNTVVIDSGSWINSEIVFYGLPEVNVTADKLLKGATAINTDGEVVNGTIENAKALMSDGDDVFKIGFTSGYLAEETWQDVPKATIEETDTKTEISIGWIDKPLSFSKTGGGAAEVKFACIDSSGALCTLDMSKEPPVPDGNKLSLSTYTIVLPANVSDDDWYEPLTVTAVESGKIRLAHVGVDGSNNSRSILS
jgi:hypothetical protein